MPPDANRLRRCKMLAMMNQGPNLVRYIRTPLGAIVALIVLVVVVTPLVVFAPVDPIFKVAYIVFFMLLVLAAFIVIVVRTPKGPHGLVASEDFYALQTYMRGARIYGDNLNPKTRDEAMEAPTKTAPSALPGQPEHPALGEGK